jgi:uroporphyrinogen decarboxylase
MAKMNSYERVMACFEGAKPDRVPVVPIVREWCCKQAGIKFTDTMTHVGKHVYSQYYSARKFGYDVVLDIPGIHAESEAMGAVLRYGEEYPPMVTEPVIKNYQEDLHKLCIPNPFRDGRLPLLLEIITRLKELCDKEIPVMGYVQCPFRHAAMLRGPENLMRDLFKNKEQARALLEMATVSQIVWGTAVAQAGADIIFFSDPTSSGDAVSPKTYQEWGLPYTKQVVSILKRTGVKVLLHICGDTSDRLEVLASTGVDGLSLDSKVDFGFAREILGPEYLLMGNVEPTNPVTFGKPETVYGHSKSVIGQAGEDGHFFLSGGCLIPAEAPVENVAAMVSAGKDCTYR